MSRISFIFILLLSLRIFAESGANGFPCTRCHSSFDKEKVSRITLPLKKDHQGLSVQHMKNEKNCMLCHSQKSTNELVMLDGRLIPYKESPQLCGQCHGPIYFDWKEGIHGKLFGKGTENKRKFICAECHDPHSPKFKKMKADAPPHRPKLGVDKVEEEPTSSLEKKEFDSK
jgi:formate-dependent nitrite reductase cytochrome c552 subunit